MYVGALPAPVGAVRVGTVPAAGGQTQVHFQLPGLEEEVSSRQVGERSSWGKGSDTGVTLPDVLSMLR